MQKSVLLLGLWLFYCSTAVEQLYASDGARRHFLSRGPSVQAYGRGETATAFLNDLSGSFYNPALLSLVNRGGLSLAHYMLFDGDMYNYFSLGQPLSDKVFMGMSGVNLRSGEIELRDRIDDAPRTTRTSQWLVTGTLAADLRESLGMFAGLNLNYLYRDFVEHTSGAVGLDIGLSRYFRGPVILGNRSKFYLGLSGQSIIRPTMQMLTEKESYPTVWRIGTAFSLPLFERYNPVKHFFHHDKVSIFCDVVLDTASDPRYSLGLEYGFLNRFFIRSGIADSITFGLGYRYGDYQIDYAIDLKSYTQFHSIGVSFYWGDVPPEEDEDFAHLMRVHSRAERLYDRNVRVAREMLDRKEYVGAADILDRTVYLMPRRKEARDTLALARDLSRREKILEARKKIHDRYRAGDFLEAYRAAIESLYVSGDDADTKALLHKIYNDALGKGFKRIKQHREETADRLVGLITSAQEKADFESAEQRLLMLKMLAGESYTYWSAKKNLEEARRNFVSNSIVRAQGLLDEKKYKDAMVVLNKAEALDSANVAVLRIKDRVISEVDRERRFTIRDRMYSDRLYYIAAEHFAKGDNDKAREAVFTLLRFNPGYAMIYPLYARLFEKKPELVSLVSGDDVEHMRKEYEKMVLQHRVRELILRAELEYTKKDYVRAYSTFLSAYDMDYTNREILAGFAKIYAAIQPKPRERHPAPKPGEWMEMMDYVQEMRGRPEKPKRRRDEKTAEQKEIEALKKDYVSKTKTAMDLAVSRGDIVTAERQIRKLQLFLSDAEIRRLRRRIR